MGKIRPYPYSITPTAVNDQALLPYVSYLLGETVLFMIVSWRTFGRGRFLLKVFSEVTHTAVLLTNLFIKNKKKEKEKKKSFSWAG